MIQKNKIKKEILNVLKKIISIDTSYPPGHTLEISKFIKKYLKDSSFFLSTHYYDKNKHSNSMYLRFEVRDKPGVLSSITKIFSKNKISIKNLIQKPNKKYNKASIIITTHKNLEKNYRNLFESFIF